MDQIYDAIIIGAGLAGLSCARQLEASGFSYLILEAADGIGGRVRTDKVDGFLLDRGFQVLLTAYPEVARVLDYSKLDLKPFLPGAIIYDGKYFSKLSDPFKDPSSLLPMMVSNIASMADKLRVAYLRQKLMATTVQEIFNQPDKTIEKALNDYGFSDTMINLFFRPFFGGITLDKSLSGSSRMFEFVYKMMAEGQVVIPARGMGKISEQLAQGLKPEAIRLSSKVASIDQEKSQVTLASGQVFQGRSIVMAADGATAYALLKHGEISKPAFRMATCLYFAAAKAPIKEAMLVLNGGNTEMARTINNLAVLTNVSRDYAPKGQELISITVLGELPGTGLELDGALEADLIRDVLIQAKSWFGEDVAQWRHLKSYRIEYALPDQTPPWLNPPSRPVKVGQNLYVCGDHRENASINGAMVSGRKAAEALTADLKIASST